MKKTAKKEYSISDLISKSGIFNDGDWIESKDQDPNGEVRLIQLADIGDGVYIDKSKRFLTLKRAQELKCTFLKKGDILIARMPDPIGRSCIFPGSEQPCVTAVDVGIIRPENNAVHNEWLKYKINSPLFRHLIREYTTGTTRKRISRKNLDKITFELPSYADQIKIVQILSKAEQLIVDRKTTIDLLDELIEAKFWEMFGDVALNSKKFPKKNLLKITSKLGSGSTPKGGKEVYLDSGDFSFIRSQNIRMFKINFDTMIYINESIHQRMKNTWVKNGDVLLNITGASIGRIAYYNKESNRANVNQHVCIIRPKPNIVDSIYLCYCIGQKNFQKKILSQNVGGTRQALNFSQIKQFEIPLPPTDKQKYFSDFVRRVDDIKSHLESSLTDLRKLINTISQLAFEGKLDLSSINAEQQELKQVKSATSFFAQQTKLLEKFAPLVKLQQTLDKINKSNEVFKSFESINKAFEVNKLPHIETLKRFEEFMVNSGIGRLDEINSYQEYLDVMNQPIFKQLDIADKFKIKGLEHFHERYLKELKELERKRRKEESKSYHGQELDETILKTILEKEFKGPFKAEILYEYLKQISLDFTYDQFVKMLFNFLKGKKPFLKQKYFETHIHEMAIPIMDLLPELQEAQKSDGLYLMLKEQ